MCKSTNVSICSSYSTSICPFIFTTRVFNCTEPIHFAWNHWHVYLHLNDYLEWCTFVFVLTVYLSTCRSTYLSIYLSMVFQFMTLYINLSICLSIHLSISKSIYLSIRLSIHLTLWMYVFASQSGTRFPFQDSNQRHLNDELPFPYHCDFAMNRYTPPLWIVHSC